MDAAPAKLRHTFWARLLLAFYWPALAVATHWPRLVIRVEALEGFPLDKAMHFAAFALLATLAVAARWFERWLTWRSGVLLTTAVLAGYAVLDEWTQTWTQRTWDVGDMLANLAGVGTVLMVALAVGQGSPCQRRWSEQREAQRADDGPSRPDESRPAPGGPAAGGAHFVRHARTFAILTFVSRILGLLREVVLARGFGAGPFTDAFVIGFQVPNLFRRLFGEGALSSAMIPVYADLLRHDPQVARRFASLCLATLAIALGVITLLAEIALAALLAARDWHPDTALAIRLTMIMLPYMPMVCAVAIIGALLQVRDRFGPSAAAPIVLNVVVILATLWAVWGGGAATAHGAVVIVSWSVIVAGAVQVAWQLAALVRLEPLTRHFAGTAAAFRKLRAIFLPMVIGLAVFQINTFADNLIAMGLSMREGGPAAFRFLGATIAYPLDAGAVASLAWAQRLYEFPLGIFGIAIATAIFPALALAAAEWRGSGQVAEWPSGQVSSEDRFRTILQQGLRLTVFIGLPASVGLILVRVPLTRVLFEGGRFTADDTRVVAAILAGYAPAIWAYAMNHVLTRAFYAVGDSRTPLRIGLAMVGLNLVLNLTLVWFFAAVGFALATAICAVLQTGLLLRAIRRYTAQPVDRAVLLGWLRVLAIVAAMTAVLLPITLLWDATAISRLGAGLQLALLVSLGAAIVLTGAILLRCDETRWLLRRR